MFLENSVRYNRVTTKPLGGSRVLAFWVSGVTGFTGSAVLQNSIIMKPHFMHRRRVNLPWGRTYPRVVTPRSFVRSFVRRDVDAKISKMIVASLRSILSNFRQNRSYPCDFSAV